MSPELEQQLYTEFPLLFRRRLVDTPYLTCGWKGIACKDGWFDLIRNLSLNLVEYSKQHYLDPVFLELKSRHGMLKLEIDCDDENIKKLCQQAYDDSAHICEVCGEPGELSYDAPYGIEVRCASHRADEVYVDVSLTDDEIARSTEINEKLRSLEQEIFAEISRQADLLRVRIADPLDPLDDFEVQAVLTFCLREDDPAYDEDDDNILTRRSFWYCENYKCSEGHRDKSREERVDYAEFNRGWGIPNHCWTFHDLYDHRYGPGQQRLHPHDILRIGSIWVDIEIQAQMFRNV
jgi:hypothetical protein